MNDSARMNAPVLENERERLRAVRRYAVLDTPYEEAFDRITRLVARLLNVPIALVTLVDETRQWFKSAYGFKPRQTRRDVSFCAHAIFDNKLMVVADATCDSRFADNALVTDDPHIRFYAGVPLQSADGYNLGTLCAIDRVPRELSAEQAEILRDLAALVRDELELRLAVRERAQQAVAIAHLRSGVVVTDASQPDNPIVFGNPGFSAMTGYAVEEVVGRNCRFLQGPDSDGDVLASIRHAIAECQTISAELLNYRKDGSPFWNELTISPVFDESGELMSFVGLQRDITQRRQLERLRDDLSHMIIHDLRSPLGAVVGFLDLLQLRTAGTLDNKAADYIARARLGAERLEEMISSLLDVNRLEAGEMPVDLETHDLVQLIESTVRSVAAGAGNKSIVFSPPNEAVSGTCDGDLVRRILLNLLSNALKFTPVGGEVRVDLLSADELVRISVSDDGPGIPPEFHGRIFEKFGQVEARKAHHSTGLGLAFCKLAVEAQRGTIGVDSDPGKGSTFYFTLASA